MLVTQQSLASILKDNVCDLRFVRRIPTPGRPNTRRMICTNSTNLLTSIDGRMTLNYAPPKSLPAYDPRNKNVVIVWDILMQSFRTINCDGCDLIKAIPANEEFWNYFREELSIMSPQQKVEFMNS